MAAATEQFIQIKGTKLAEWSDYGDGIYNAADNGDTLAELGDIVDHTSTTQSSGVLYLRIIDGGDVFIADKYIAVALKNKTTAAVSFMTGATAYGTIEAVKVACNNANDTGQFPATGFYGYTK